MRERNSDLRVSLVELTGTGVVFAPHDHSPWLRLPPGGLADADLEVGQVGQLHLDDGGTEWMFEVDAEQRVVPVELTNGSNRGDQLLFKIKPGGDTLDLAGHGVDKRQQGKAQKLGFWRLQPRRAGDPAGHFAHPDLAEWARELDRAAADAKHEKELNRDRSEDAEQRAQSGDHFVNPYTFVPFPASAPHRSSPAGHHELGQGRLSGQLTARLVARSPLLVRAVGTEAPTDEHGMHLAPRRDGALFVPGSSLHGAIRSLHETLTGSCLRVFDQDFVPVYRDVASTALRQHWGLAVVTEVDGGTDWGRPTAIAPCTSTGWVRLTTLAAALPVGTPVTAGQRFDLPGGFPKANGRDVYDDTQPATHNPGGRWIALVTNPSTRQNVKRPREYFCAVGQLPPAATDPVRLTDSAWRVFKKAAEGVKATFVDEPKATFADECQQLEQLRQHGNDPLGAAALATFLGSDGTHTGPSGTSAVRFLQPRPWLHPGRVVWIARPRGGFTDGIALAYLWRSPGQDPAGRRIPPGFAGCHDPNELCPSCRLFGSADLAEDRSIDRKRANQRSYRGHVRVLDALAEDAAVYDEPVRLPAVGGPRPGAGQFYLDDDATDAFEGVPRNRWGSDADQRGARHLRGRKFYWHTDPVLDQRRARWRRHEHAGGTQGDVVELVKDGSSYRLRLRFDGLTPAELGGLIAALQPQLLFQRLDPALPYHFDGQPQWAIHVGGGKPLGLGSCQVHDLTVQADTAASRYLDEDRPAVTAAEAVAAFAQEHAALAEHWRQVSAALHVDHVDSRIVGYPTAHPWVDEDGTCGGKQQHESFEWFSRTTGEWLKTGDRLFTPLPLVQRRAQGLRTDAGSQR